MQVACLQLNSGDNEAENLQAIDALVAEAASQADFLFLPENAVYMPPSSKALYEHAGQSPQWLEKCQEIARKHQKWLMLGSLAVRSEQEGKCYNRSFAIDADGTVVEHYDKIHLFDVVLEGGESHKESDSFMPGQRAVTTPLGDMLLGMSICYDVRFPELYRHLAQGGAEVIAVPAAFTAYTGAAHWHSLLRARAIENQSYIIAAAQTGRHPKKRETYGHSLIIDPWGEILADAGCEVGFITAEINKEKVAQVRKQLPSLTHDRKFI